MIDETDARDWLRAEFDRCRPWIKAALDRDIGTHNIDDVWDAISSGNAQLWPRPESVAVTLIELYPRCKALRWWIVGGNLEDLLVTEKNITHWAKNNGCVRVIAGGRRGWVRTLPGYTEVCTVITKVI